MADVAVVEMVDLPLADSEGAIEKQLKTDNGMFNLVNLWNQKIFLYIEYFTCYIVFHANHCRPEGRRL